MIENKDFKKFETYRDDERKKVDLEEVSEWLSARKPVGVYVFAMTEEHMTAICRGMTVGDLEDCLEVLRAGIKKSKEAVSDS